MSDENSDEEAGMDPDNIKSITTTLSGMQIQDPKVNVYLFIIILQLVLISFIWQDVEIERLRKENEQLRKDLLFQQLLNNDAIEKVFQCFSANQLQEEFNETFNFSDFTI